jgi:hypothetical protein
MAKLDFTDGLIVGFIVVAGAYLWVHPSDVNFATFCGLSAIFHLTRVYDDKKADAC